ncbi:MAG: aldo/keto reductase, partial [Lentisphaerae bacterium]
IPRNPERFEFLKDPGDPSVVQGALRFLLSDPRITVALVGFSDTRQLQDALLAVKDFKPWSKERIDATRQQLRSAFNEMCTGCAYCDNCPVELPIPKLMDAYNQYMFDRNKQSAINRLRYHWSLLREPDFYRQCIECGACEQACTQHLPIIERIKELAEMVEEYQAQQQ